MKNSIEKSMGVLVIGVAVVCVVMAVQRVSKVEADMAELQERYAALEETVLVLHGQLDECQESKVTTTLKDTGSRLSDKFGRVVDKVKTGIQDLKGEPEADSIEE